MCLWFANHVHVPTTFPRVGPGCVFCPRIDPLRFLAGCRRRRLNQGLVVALGFFLVRYGMFLCYFFGLWVHALFSLLTFLLSVQCNWLPGKICPRNDLYVSSGTLNLTKLKLKLKTWLQGYVKLLSKKADSAICCSKMSKNGHVAAANSWIVPSCSVT